MKALKALFGFVYGTVVSYLVYPFIILFQSIGVNFKKLKLLNAIILLPLMVVAGAIGTLIGEPFIQGYRTAVMDSYCLKAIIYITYFLY
ncbi:MAG: hypothetical protein JO131_00040 [Gammaproteobacteria bacterium]|nr:hypothetical protein [Gammaproteobacteria bacterium]